MSIKRLVSACFASLLALSGISACDSSGTSGPDSGPSR
jgi:hypothetical protein